LELVLCLGAGSSVDLSDYSALDPKRLIFVEGDPDAADRLSHSLAGEARCEVVPALVTPMGAKIPFYRYNLASLNGTLPIGELQTLYPRLKVVEERELSSRTLSSLLEPIPMAGPGKRLLIFDIPGQEAAILGSVHPEHLRAFEWILVRGCRKALQDGAHTMEESVRHLEESLFERVALDEDSDPAWPAVLLHLDRRRAELYQELKNRARLLIENATENDLRAKRIAELEAQLNSKQGELDRTRQQLGVLNEIIGVAEAANADLENRARQLMERAKENDLQAKRIVELETQLNTIRGELDGTRRQFGELEQRMQEAEAARKWALQEAANREAVATAASENGARLLAEKAAENELQARRIAELEAQVTSTQNELEGRREQVGELKQRIELIEAAKIQELMEAADREMAAVAERDNRAAQLAGAHERVAALEAEVASQKTLVEVLSKGRSQQDKLYQQLSQERDGLRGEIEALGRRILELEGLLSSRETRGRLIDAEFQKVEGQIDLIKEIFLRENS